MLMTGVEELAETIKLRLYPTAEQELAFSELSYWYMKACNFVSNYVFSHDFCTNSVRLSTEHATRRLILK